MARNKSKSGRHYFDEVDTKIKFPELEEEILRFWKKEKIFEKSIETRPKNKKWTFLDGPPFITGLPHYGSLLSSIPKDLFPRYKTMKGFRVRRVWGWDCHGLPAENKVENKLGIKSKKEIEEKVGIKRFIKECKLYVSETSSEWEWYVDRIGRWVDFKNAYKTMDKDYMETVMWVFKSIYDKGYIYKGLRVSLYCPHCETPISNFEVAMDSENYKEISEPSTTYKYKLKNEDSYLLAWSTTPWNKIATPALAVNPELDYLLVKQGDEKYILAKKTLKMLKPKPEPEVLDKFKGSELVGKKFVPHYDYYKSRLKKDEKAFVVVPADYVTADEGTGIVTLAIYGEEDLEILKKERIYMEMHVTDDGYIKKQVPKFGGMYYLDANEKVDSDLEKRGLIYKKEEISHTIPYCWRCGTRLFHNPQDAWFVDIQSLKPGMKKNNKNITWIPKHFKYGRFLKSMEAAPDWCISRSRYWGSPVPVWICEKCDKRHVPGSIDELEELSGVKIKGLHKPEIDNVKIKCSCGGVAERVPEVLDSWTEAGSAPFAERHYPFDKNIDIQDFFPPDFVTEYTGQIRAWFYVLHVISTALFDSHAFKNVVVTGVILGDDGRKMSKNYGNYPDPKKMLQKYGGDGLRLYLMGSTVMKGEDILISEQDYRNSVRGFLLPLWNVYNFFTTYANLHDWKPGKKAISWEDRSSKNILDKWIISNAAKAFREIEKAYEDYDTQKIVELSRAFLVNDFSGWFIRRSRESVSLTNKNKSEVDDTLFTIWSILRDFVKILAPLTPFITENIYKNITKNKSVHLKYWPEISSKAVDENLLSEMDQLREIVEKGHAARKELQIPVRQPLRSLSTSVKDLKDLEYLIKDELNVKEVRWDSIKSDELSVKLDTKITPQLMEEAKARELIRNIQQKRKEMEVDLTQKIEVKSPWVPKNKNLLQTVKEKTLATKLQKSNEFNVESVS